MGPQKEVGVGREVVVKKVRINKQQIWLERNFSFFFYSLSSFFTFFVFLRTRERRNEGHNGRFDHRSDVKYRYSWPVSVTFTSFWKTCDFIIEEWCLLPDVGKVTVKYGRSPILFYKNFCSLSSHVDPYRYDNSPSLLQRTNVISFSAGCGLLYERKTFRKKMTFQDLISRLV